MLQVKEQFTSDNHATCFRIHMWLAKLHLTCGRFEEAQAACDTLLKQAKTLKDKVPVYQIQIQILLVQGNRQDALKRALAVLEQMGESFPSSGQQEIIARELEQLRTSVRHQDNSKLLQPPRMTDKKALDVIALLAFVIEIARLARKKGYQELAMIRMMNLSLRSGFTRQYPMAFGYFAVSLLERGIKAENPTMVKEAHRVGQICEKMARMGDFYGGSSVALFVSNYILLVDPLFSTGLNDKYLKYVIFLIALACKSLEKTLC
jgi:hypothetical protein